MRSKSKDATVDFREALKLGARKAFAAEWGSLDLMRLKRLHQVETMLELERRVRRHPLVIDELVFDRLLLARSLHYRRTRELAHLLGAKLVPKLESRAKGYRHWDPGQTEIGYSPLAPDLIRACELPRESAFGPDSWRRFNQLRRFLRSTYHELNHFIVFSLLRPARGTGSPKLYYALAEGLVKARDAELARELGSCAAPFVDVYALYYSEFHSDDERAARLESDELKRVICYHFLRNSGETNVATRIAFEQAGREFWEREIYNDLPADGGIFRGWAEQYSRRHGKNVRLPPLASTGRLRPGKFPLCGARKLLRDETRLDRLSRWYGRVFHDPAAFQLKTNKY